MFHDFAGRDDVELSEADGSRIAVDEFVIQTESRTEFQVWLVDVDTHDMGRITTGLCPEEEANTSSPHPTSTTCFLLRFGSCLLMYRSISGRCCVTQLILKRSTGGAMGCSTYNVLGYMGSKTKC